jgi:NRPS condensation-like uncharacterized protein
VSSPGAVRQPRTRFAVADELTCYYDRPAEPANVHLEAQLACPLDETALRAAVSAVLAAEPGIRARQAAGGGWRPGYSWEFPQAADGDPVQVASYADQAGLARLRSRLISQSPPLRTSPTLRFLLAKGTQGDVLILNAHHARFDGLSCLRLLSDVAASYTERTGNHDDSASRPAAAQRPAEGTGQPPPEPPARTRAGRITRVASQRDPGSAGSLPGYGAYLSTWGGLAAARRGRAGGYSVNDLLITALMVTISEWNESLGARSDLIAITMPVGEPSQAGAAGEWANRSRLTKVTARVPPGTAAAGLLADVASQTRYAKQHPGAQVDLFSRTLTAAPVPVAVKQVLLRTTLRVAGPFACDSCLISNLGVVPAVRFGPAGAARIWFSTSAHMPRGLSLGAVTTGDELRLTFRYRLALFSDAAAESFACRYVGILDRIAGRDVPD